MDYCSLFLALIVVCQSLTYDYLPVSRDPPPVRLYNTMTHSPSQDSLVVFGGQLDANKNYNDLWTYSLSDSKWQQQTSSSQIFPSILYLGERFSHGMFNIEEESLSCIFGGTTAHGPLSDIWCFSWFYLTWSPLVASGDKVQPRYRFSYVSYDHTDGKTYFAVFGGDSKIGKLNDLCILDISSLTWSCITPSSAPFERSGGTMQYYDGFLYIAGGDGQNNAVQVDDFYRFNLATSEWEDVTRSNTYESITLTASLIYQNYFYLFFGWKRTIGADSSKIFRVDLESDFEWTEVADIPSLARDSFGISLKDSNAYIFAGYTSQGLVNDLVTIDLSQSTFEYSKTEVMKTPPLRVYHSFEPIYGSLYLFGGDSEGQKLSDLWSFDITNEKWNSIETTGNPPSVRSNHGSTSLGDSLIIWGGINESGYLNDMFKYSVNTNSWEELVSVSSLVPTPRASACVVLLNPYIFIYGGITETGLSSELWRYDIGLQEYTLIDSGSQDGPLGISKHKCSIEVREEDTLFYVMFGTGEAEAAKGEVHYFSINDNKWKLVHKSDRARNWASVNKINDKIVIGGGEVWGIFPEKDIFAIDLSNCSEGKCKETEIGNLDDYFLNGASTYYLNHLFFHGGSDPLSNIIRTNVAKNSFYKIDLSEFLDCSLGSESINSKCEFCKKGYYNEAYNSNCTACEEGFYNTFIGSSSFRQCFPCEEGTFNPYEGAHYCLECPVHSKCSIGSKDYIFETTSQIEYSFQPDFYEYRTEEAESISFYLMIAISFVGLGIVALFIFWNKLHSILYELDLFDSLHTFEEGEPIIIQKNKIGGAFGIIFYIVGLIMIFSAVPPYVMDNLLETKALVPYIIVESDYDFFSQITISVELDSYYAPCVLSSNQCDSSISFNALNIDTKGEITKKCFESEENCRIVLDCDQCSINSSSALNLEFSHPISYSSQITVNVTSFSSIPDEYSSVSYSIQSDTGKVFRGSPASVFYINMASSVYKNSITSREGTGYHAIITKSPDLGGMYSVLDVPFTNNLFVNLELSRSENCLMTLHDEKNPILLLILTLFGSVTGALGIIGMIMSNIEKCYRNARNKQKKKASTNEMINQRKDLKVFFQNIEPKVIRRSMLKRSGGHRRMRSVDVLIDKKEREIDEIF